MSYVRKLINKDNPKKYGYEAIGFGITRFPDDVNNIIYPNAASAENVGIDILNLGSRFFIQAEKVDRKFGFIIRFNRENFICDGSVYCEYIGCERVGSVENLHKIIMKVIDAGGYVKCINERDGDSTLCLQSNTTVERMEEFFNAHPEYVNK